MQLNFDLPDEILTSVEGYHCSFQGSIFVISLKFISNRAIYGPFGTTPSVGGHATPFTLPVVVGKIIGFYGNSDQYLDAIGVCLSLLTSYDFVWRQPFATSVKFEVSDVRFSSTITDLKQKNCQKS